MTFFFFWDNKTIPLLHHKHFWGSKDTHRYPSMTPMGPKFRHDTNNGNVILVSGSTLFHFAPWSTGHANTEYE
jgi:hypothetical protein